MRILSKSVKGTLKIGRAIARNAKKGDIICLFGNLGSGKTVLAKGIAEGLGIKASEIVSPTFILIHGYEKAKLPLYHFDFYRLRSVKDILDLGYEEFFFGQGISVVEWADRLKTLLPQAHLAIKLSVKGHNSRLFEFKAKGSRYEELLRKINENIRH